MIIPQSRLAQNLRYLREYHERPQSWVARKAGISKTYLCELEADTSNKKAPSAIVVYRLARVFDQSVEFLLFQNLP